jgi:hypothetical protein
MGEESKKFHPLNPPPAGDIKKRKTDGRLEDEYYNYERPDKKLR